MSIKATVDPTLSLQAYRVDAGLLESILVPYKPGCRYLRSAEVTFRDPDVGSKAPVAVARGEFAIPESCYVDDTGHFNSVEFSLCFDQLVYVLIAQCIASRHVPEMATMAIEEYRRRQLSGILIHDLQSSFRRPLDTRAFRGFLAIDGLSQRRGLLCLKTNCYFEDNAGGRADGHVTLSVVDRH